MLRECRCAATAPAMSIRCITRPPSTLPSGLVAFGRTTSIISTSEAATVLPFNLAMVRDYQHSGRKTKTPCSTRADFLRLLNRLPILFDRLGRCKPLESLFEGAMEGGGRTVNPSQAGDKKIF